MVYRQYELSVLLCVNELVGEAALLLEFGEHTLRHITCSASGAQQPAQPSRSGQLGHRRIGEAAQTHVADGKVCVRRPEPRRPSEMIARVPLGPVVHQPLRSRLTAVPDRPVERSCARIVGGVQWHPMAHKPLHNSGRRLASQPRGAAGGALRGTCSI
jgi:hypothetical protein